jgi:hypothetical protein
VRRQIIHTGAVALVLALSGCPSLPDLEWEGEHVRFGADNPEQVCGGTLEYLDHRAGQLKARFGATFLNEEMLPADRYVVQFYLPLEAGPALFEVYING